MIDVVLKAVREEFELTAEEISTKSARRQATRIVEGKQVAALLLWKYSVLLNIHRIEIAKALGYDNKQSAIAAARRAKRISSANKAFRARIENIDLKLLRD